MQIKKYNKKLDLSMSKIRQKYDDIFVIISNMDAKISGKGKCIMLLKKGKINFQEVPCHNNL